MLEVVEAVGQETATQRDIIGIWALDLVPHLVEIEHLCWLIEFNFKNKFKKKS